MAILLLWQLLIPTLGMDHNLSNTCHQNPS